ncbi:MAG TPA: hypothetical protein VF168_07310 [Trueperaceae bacterium]
MSRIMMMTSTTAALLVSACALAWGWQAGTRLTLVTSDGARIIGVGGVHEGEVEITIERNFKGYAVLMIESPDGALETFDVVVEPDGNIVVGAGGNYSNLSDSTERAGLGYRLSLDDGAQAQSPASSVEPSSLIASQSALDALGLKYEEPPGLEVAERARSLGKGGADEQ